MTRKRVLLIAIFAVLSTLSCAWGGEGTNVDAITLDQAIENAISNNPRLKAAGYQIEIAEAGITKAGSGYLPKIDLSETYQRTTNPMWAFGHKLNQESITSADFAPNKLNNPDPIDNWGTALTLTQPLYTGGKVSAYTGQARLNREAAHKEMERTRQELVFDVTKAYYAIALAEANQEVVKDLLKSAEANMEMARALLKAGVVVESDFLSARVNWSESMEEDIRAANAVVLSKAQLQSIMGMEIIGPYETSEKLVGGIDKLSGEAIFSKA